MREVKGRLKALKSGRTFWEVEEKGHMVERWRMESGDGRVSGWGLQKIKRAMVFDLVFFRVTTLHVG